MQALNFPPEITSKYEIIQEMGRGAFSTVYKIKSKIDNNIYCLKKINLKKTPDKKNEINILSKLNHPNLVQYISSCSDDEGIYIIMEFCIYGDLYSLLHMVKKKKVYVNEEIIWDIAYQCLLALEYLHSQHIIHRDIKLLNIFMSHNKSVKIGDMGMSKILSNKEMKLSRVGTPLYLAPELIRKEKYDYKADIWSFGCSLYHLARTVPPFNDENLIRLGQAIINDNPASLPSCYTEELNHFINKLMTKDKKLRPSATEALKLIPQKTKNKLDISNYPNLKLMNLNRSDSKTNKSSKKIKTNLNNSKNKDISSILSYSNSGTTGNEQIKNSHNELVSGQTFYKLFRKNNDRFDKKGTTNNFTGGKFGNKTSSQNFLFDSKNMNSYFIMSKTMGGTREGFFKKNKNLLNSNENNNLDSNGFVPSEEIKINNYEKKENSEYEETKKEFKPLISKLESRRESNKSKEKIIINAKLSLNNDNGNDKKESSKNISKSLDNNKFVNKNNMKEKMTENNTLINRIFNFNNIKNNSNNRDANIEIKNVNHFLNKKSVNKNKSKIDFFTFKNFQKDIKNIKNEQIKDESNKKNSMNFPLIQKNRIGKTNSERFNNNNLNGNLFDFRKTANGFPFSTKLTIHDLK